MYLFLRARLGWDAGNYGVFSIYNSLISGFGESMCLNVRKLLDGHAHTLLACRCGSVNGNFFALASTTRSRSRIYRRDWPIFGLFHLYLCHNIGTHVFGWVIEFQYFKKIKSEQYLSIIYLLAPAVDMMNGTMWVIAKAMVSKVVMSEEYGKVFTVFGLISSLVPLVADPAYAFLYRATVSSYLPGAVFFLSAALTLPPQIIYA